MNSRSEISVNMKERSGGNSKVWGQNGGNRNNNGISRMIGARVRQKETATGAERA